MLSGDALVEDQGVGGDGAGHVAGLGNIGHSQEAGDLPGGSWGLVFEFVQDDRGPFDAVLQGVGGEVHFLPGNGDQPDRVGQVGNGAFEPARFGEAAAVLVEDAVGEAGVGDGLRYVVGVADRFRVTEGDGGLDGAGLAGDAEFEAVGRVLFRLGGGFVLGFDDHGGAAWRGHGDVGVLAEMGREGLGVLGEDPAAGHHGAE